MGSPLPTANFDGHLARVISDLPVTFKWNGVDYQGVESSPDVSLSLDIGGAEQAIEFSIFARVSVLPVPPPAADDVFVVHGKVMRVAHVKTTPDGVMLSFAMAFARKAYP